MGAAARTLQLGACSSYVTHLTCVNGTVAELLCMVAEPAPKVVMSGRMGAAILVEDGRGAVPPCYCFANGESGERGEVW